MTWLIKILMICLEEKLPITYYMVKHLILLKILNMTDIKEVLIQWFINLLLKSSDGAIKSEVIFILRENIELHKLIIRKFEKQKVYSSFIDKIWDVDLGDMQLIRKFNKGMNLQSK